MAVSLSLTPQLRAQLQAWLMEDLGRGDLTAPALQGRHARAHWIAKPMGCFAVVCCSRRCCISSIPRRRCGC